MAQVDYSLYLVTDSTMIPESSTFLKQVEAAIENGATLVQLREKSISTLDFVDRAKQVHELTKKKGIPLIINDRIDVALAIDAEGVHIGQDDMPATLARKLLGPNKILGVTCSTPEEVKVVVTESVADYVGLGTVYQTNTKKDVTDPEGTGPLGIRKMLRVLGDYNSTATRQIRSVAIGGINHSNADKVLTQCQVGSHKLDGVAIVSCIMAAEDAAKATRDLLHVIKNPPAWTRGVSHGTNNAVLRTKVIELAEEKPLVHHITNNVVKNFSANVTLAIGASPIMSELPEEFEEFASGIPNIALVLNLGTPSESLMKIFKHALQVYNKYGKHVVFDPVACGASKARLQCTKALLNAGQMSVIKGNLGEIMAIRKLSSTYTPPASSSNGGDMRGVDSIAKLTEPEILSLAYEVARDFQAVVVITGEMNYVVDAYGSSVRVKGGNRLMGYITGTGCSLGSTIAAFLAAKADGSGDGDFYIFDAVVGALEVYNSAGYDAAQHASTPGSFMTQFIDNLYEHTSTY
ncbi:Hydroxyethylthiazole kinase family-domain-containing protein [Scheffersomyces xylosifermentans]|uniref:Hydroxyethylthiazole kinase family-domain-containing protein n=1 Tax=Scheffersomyces xylosifermentans TaxID=1304137 RepID=UPI00315C80AD